MLYIFEGHKLEFNGPETALETHISEKYILQYLRNTVCREGRGGEWGGGRGSETGLELEPRRHCSTCCCSAKASHANVGINAREAQGET